MPDSYFVGLRDTSDVVTDERPFSWRDGMRELFPNGMVPLTGLTSLMPSEKVSDPRYNWWERGLPTQKSAVSNVADSAAGATYTGAADPVGFNHFWTIAAADFNQFKVGHVVLLVDASDFRTELRAEITSLHSPNIIGTRSLEVAPYTAGSPPNGHDMSNADTMLIIGSMHEEGAPRPTAISQSPEKRWNLTQIFRNSLSNTRTAMETTLRPGKMYNRAKGEALLLHGIEMEKAFLFGERFEGTANGHPKRATRGLIPTIKNEGGHMSNYMTDDTEFDGKKWTASDGGNRWLNKQLEVIFRQGTTERLAFCGSGALLGIQELAMEIGTYNITAGETSWGTNIRTWITPFGTVTMVTHPLFSYEPVLRNKMVIFEPARITYRYVTDTMFKSDRLNREGGADGIDGKLEEYLTEAGLQIEFPETCGILDNVGKDNPS